MTWLLLIHNNRAQWIFACYRFADYDGRPNLHVKIVACCWYYLPHNFKLLAWYNTLPNRDGEHGVLLYRNSRSRICFLTSFVSVFILFLPLSVYIFLGFFPCKNISCVCLLHKFVVLLQFAAVSSCWTGKWDWNLDPHICHGQTCSFITASLVIK